MARYNYRKFPERAGNPKNQILAHEYSSHNAKKQSGLRTFRISMCLLESVQSTDFFVPASNKRDEVRQSIVISGDCSSKDLNHKPNIFDYCIMHMLRPGWIQVVTGSVC